VSQWLVVEGMIVSMVSTPVRYHRGSASSFGNATGAPRLFLDRGSRCAPVLWGALKTLAVPPGRLAWTGQRRATTSKVAFFSRAADAVGGLR